MRDNSLRRNMSRGTLLVIVAALLPLAVSGCKKYQSASTFQTVQMKSLEDSTVTVGDYHGKVVLVNFWATWCDPCRIEIPWLIEMQQKYGPRGFVILGIALDEEGKSVVAPFVAKERFDVNGQKEPMSYKILIGDDAAAEKFGGLFGYPTSILISRDGKQIKRITGIISYDEISKVIESQL